ncbi:hypothetical protein GAG18_00905 [Salmonella enterica]|uniref:Bacteriophage protein n=1 Tax=Salmonella enterica TaxID=28901 RepID=A0A634F7K6_SALER|nr:hypothetical protein [Salmonella enterica]EAV7065331.1 hypothetical protein [Salmonella enterica subsp. arizonae serovar 63:z36:-]EDU9480879.1 hypothetical protein [Salmonella enterica subsp. arizonae]EAU6968774.1 hypothetical protein [Salmonella enterica]EAV4984214.1 hypothetical protein [Salmonella enterica]
MSSHHPGCYYPCGHRNRYDLSRDQEGLYCREVVKRMFETWCHCRGLNVECGDRWRPDILV